MIKDAGIFNTKGLVMTLNLQGDRPVAPTITIHPFMSVTYLVRCYDDTR